jgi:(S)-ureidoglycine aminohydrolase
MKLLMFIIGFLAVVGWNGTDNRVESGIYSFSKTPFIKTETGGKRQLMDGETTHMERFEIHATTLNPGQAPHGSQIHADEEELVIIKEGKLKVTINNESKVMGVGSVVLVEPGDEHALNNAADEATTYYIVKYKSKQPINVARGKDAGGSVMIDWDNLTFTPHDKGGVRRYFDRKSAMSDRIEMHVTTLNPNIKSHEPHTHLPAEIIIMMDGTTEMEIGDKLYQGTVGDIYFLGSNIPHGIRNTGDKPCMYMAFQWQ